MSISINLELVNTTVYDMNIMMIWPYGSMASYDAHDLSIRLLYTTTATGWACDIQAVNHDSYRTRTCHPDLKTPQQYCNC